MTIHGASVAGTSSSIQSSGNIGNSGCRSLLTLNYLGRHGLIVGVSETVGLAIVECKTVDVTSAQGGSASGNEQRKSDAKELQRCR